MLTENDVVQAVAAHLQSEGYHIDQELSTVKHGIDIIATKQTPRMRLLVEAKGGTSSKEFTNRYGKEFTQNQAKSHVSVAFYYAARLRQLHADEITRVALAFPDDKNHRLLVDQIRTALEKLEILVFFVDSSRRVATY